LLAAPRTAASHDRIRSRCPIHPTSKRPRGADAMDVVYLFQDPYPWDIRVEKIVVGLTQAGHSVHLVARNRGNERLHERLEDGLDVSRLPRGFSRWDNYLWNFPAFFSPLWIGRVLQIIHRTRAAVIIVRDLPLAPAAWIAGLVTGIPVMMDMAENYPAMIESTWRFRGPRLIDYIVRNPRWLRRLERFVVPRLGAVLVVSEANERRVRALARRMPPIWVVGNTPRLELSGQHVRHPVVEMLNGHAGLSLLYTGFLEHMRGLDVVVRALTELVSKKVRPLFVVVGDGESRPELEQLASTLGVREYIHFAGWVDQRYLPAIIAAADVCLIPHYATEHTDTTLPNKIFDYMAQGKPVIVTHAAALREIVEEVGCGVSYRDDQPQQLAERISILVDPAQRQRMGDAGRAAVQEKFNWTKDLKTLLQAIDQTAHLMRATDKRPAI
jgi:glycosyltransferase involved in cell wall biosynthesis